MEKFTFDLATGKKFHAEQEPDNAVDKFAMKVVKKQRNSWRFTSWVLANFLVLYSTRCKDMHGSDWPQMSLETAVRRNGDSLNVGVNSCWSKAKINLLESKIRR